MKRIAKCLLSAVMLCCFGLSLMLTGSAAEGDEIRSAKKIISVVYDDSGSMCGDRWVYTSYAMQALTAQLNEQDELYITYMSNENSAVRIDLTDIEGSVQSIRGWSNTSGTPAGSMDTAKAKLDSISESDTSTQFWLVIMTDGSFSGLSGSLQNKLESMAGDTMSNGSPLNVVYLGMGSTEQVSAKEKKGLYSFSSDSNDTITEALGDVANLISGRIAVDQVRQVDDHTISFESKLPLYSISILSQQSAASVASARTTEQKLDISRNIALDAQDPFGYTDLTLYGNAAVISLTDSSGSRSAIPAGTYEITFSEAVDAKDLVVQYEPAIGLKVVVSKNGIEIDDYSQLGTGEKVDIKVIPVVPGTEEEIDLKDLPDGIDWTIEYFVDDTSVDSGTGRELTGVALQDGENMIRCTMQIPGFSASVYDIYFELEEFILNLGIDVDQPEHLNYQRGDLGAGSDSGESVVFFLTNDGVPLTKEEQKTMNVALEITDVSCDDSNVTGFLHRLGKKLVSCDLELQDDGSYKLVPKSILPVAFLLKAGDYTVTVSVKQDGTITETGAFSLEPSISDWIDLAIVVGGLLVLIYLIYIIFIKYKFKGQTVRMDTYKLLANGRGSEIPTQTSSKVLSVLSGGLLLPTRACRVKFEGVVLQAGPDGEIIITGKSIARAVSHYGASGSNPVTSLSSIVTTMRPTERKTGKRTTRSASDQTLSANRPVYFRSSENDRNIWRIRIMH